MSNSLRKGTILSTRTRFIAAAALAAVLTSGLGALPATAATGAGSFGSAEATASTVEATEISSLAIYQGVGGIVSGTPNGRVYIIGDGDNPYSFTVLLDEEGNGKFSTSMRAGDHFTAKSSESADAEVLFEGEVLPASDLQGYSFGTPEFKAGKGLTVATSGYTAAQINRSGWVRPVSNGEWSLNISDVLSGYGKDSGYGYNVLRLTPFDSKTFSNDFHGDPVFYTIPEPGVTSEAITVDDEPTTWEGLRVTRAQGSDISAAVATWTHNGVEYEEVLTFSEGDNYTNLTSQVLPEKGDVVTVVGYTNAWQTTAPVTVTINSDTYDQLAATINADGSGKVSVPGEYSISVGKIDPDSSDWPNNSATWTTNSDGSWDSLANMADQPFASAFKELKQGDRILIRLYAKNAEGSTFKRSYQLEYGVGLVQPSIRGGGVEQPERVDSTGSVDAGLLRYSYDSSGTLVIFGNAYRDLTADELISGGWEYRVDGGEWLRTSHSRSLSLSFFYPDIVAGQVIELRYTDGYGNQVLRQITVPDDEVKIVDGSTLSIDPINAGDTQVTVRGIPGYVYVWNQFDASGNKVDSFWGIINSAEDEAKGGDAVGTDTIYLDDKAHSTAIDGDIWQVQATNVSFGVASYKAGEAPLIQRIVGAEDQTVVPETPETPETDDSATPDDETTPVAETDDTADETGTPEVSSQDSSTGELARTGVGDELSAIIAAGGAAMLLGSAVIVARRRA